MRPAPLIRDLRPDLLERARDKRPVLPSPTPGSLASEGHYGTFAAQIEADQLELSAVRVTERTMRGLPACEFAVNRIANAVASMSPLNVFEGDTITRRSPTPLVAHRPLAGFGTFDFWHMAVSTALRTGNFVGLLHAFNPDGYPEQVVPVPSNYVICYVDQAGFTVYEVLGHRFSAEEVVHIRGPHTMIGNPWALSPVEVFRVSLSEARDIQTYGSNSFSTGSVPSAVVSLDRDEVPEAVALQVQTDWISKHGSGQRKPAVVPRTMTITPLSWSPHDADFIEAKKLTLAECAMVFGLHPTDLGVSIGGAAMTYANISDQQNERIIDAYGPWMRRFEEGWSDLIAGDATCRFDPDRPLRMSPRERAEVQAIRIGSGVTTIDEERDTEGKPPIATITPLPAAPVLEPQP